MKLVIRALVLGIAVSGLAASALTAHMGNNPAMANSHLAATMAGQQVVGMSPAPTCFPNNCGFKTGGGLLHK